MKFIVVKDSVIQLNKLTSFRRDDNIPHIVFRFGDASIKIRFDTLDELDLEWHWIIGCMEEFVIFEPKDIDD